MAARFARAESALRACEFARGESIESLEFFGACGGQKETTGPARLSPTHGLHVWTAHHCSPGWRLLPWRRSASSNWQQARPSRWQVLAYLLGLLATYCTLLN